MNKDSKYFKTLIINSLNRGRDNAVTQEYIKNKTGICKREIRRIMQILRQEGYPICSTTYDGYWIAETKEELDSCINQILAQARTLNETAIALLETKSKLFGE